MLNPIVLLESPLDAQRFRWLRRVGLALTLIVLGGLLVRDGAGALGRVLAVAFSAQVIGKLLIFVGANDRNAYGFGEWELGFLITLVDLWIGIGLNTFLPQLERLPRLGPWLVSTRLKAATAYHQYPRLKRTAFGGVVLWVMLPVPAAGAITGSLLTRLSGLPRASATLAIVVGSAINGVVFAAMASLFGAHGQTLIENPTFTLLSSLGLIALLWLGWRRIHRLLREA